jgi:phenylpyruvate tautomerase PptA (4-oxalocrotonate tautomerase family)
MPVLQFYTNPNQLTPEEKEELVKTLTDAYAKWMPAFFVNIMFNEVSHSHPPLSVHSLSLTSILVVSFHTVPSSLAGNRRMENLFDSQRTISQSTGKRMPHGRSYT